MYPAVLTANVEAKVAMEELQTTSYAAKSGSSARHHRPAARDAVSRAGHATLAVAAAARDLPRGRGPCSLVSAEVQASRRASSRRLPNAGAIDSLTEAQREQTRADRSTTSPLFLGASFATSAIGLLIGWLLGAGILYFGLAIGGTELAFAAMVAAV